MRHGQNTTFHGSDPTWANACVGENGSPDLREYAEGYAAAANVLVETVLKSRGLQHPADLFIYPICFNMRHAVELFLKKSVAELSELAAIRRQKIPSFDSKQSHDLGRIWKFVSTQSCAADERFRTVIGELDQYISDIAAVDSTGQVFRYPIDIENKKHLTEIAVISIANLYARFRSLQKLLKQLHRLSAEIIREYEWGTFTEKLSRHNLISIALELPQRSEWENEIFDLTKVRLRAKYDLSANEYSRALKLIQGRHEIAGLLGVKVEIPDFSLECTEAILRGWLEVHGLDMLRNSFIPSDEDWGKMPPLEEIIKYNSKMNKVVDDLVSRFSPPNFAVIKALYYFEQEPFVSEAFDRLLLSAQRDAELDALDKDTYWDSVEHVLSKVSLIPAVLNSLNFLARPDAVEHLIDRCGLQELREKMLERSANAKNAILESH